MKKSERIRRLEGMIERMASQGGRDKRELAKARGRIKELEAQIEELERQPTTFPLPCPRPWLRWWLPHEQYTLYATWTANSTKLHEEKEQHELD